MSELSDKAKRLVRKIKAKREEEGKVKIENVDAPKKLKAKHEAKEKELESKKHKPQAKGQAVGPKGGVYEVTSTGSKKYGVQKSLEEIASEDERIEKVIKKVKEERSK